MVTMGSRRRTLTKTARGFFALASAPLALACYACNAILGNEAVSLDRGIDASALPDVARPEGSADTAVCVADLATDPKNCGACGHDCLGGGCAGGACQPFVVATNLSGPAHLATDDAGTLFVVTNEGAVRSCPTKGCGPDAGLVTSIGPDAGNPLLSGLAVSGGSVYFAGYYTASIYVCPTGGCPRPTVIAGGIPNPFHVATDATNVYFVSASAPFVGRCALPACAGGAVRMATDGLKAYYGTLEDGSYVYWYGGGPTQQFDRSIVYRTSKTSADAGPEILARDRTLKFSGPARTSLALRGMDLYFPEDGPDVVPPQASIVRLTLGAGAAPTPIATKLPLVRGLGVDDTHVYFVSYQAGVIGRCERAGCATPTILATGQDTPTGPLVTDDAVYWTEYFAGTIKGVAK